MIASAWTEADIQRAKGIWAEYQQQHDVSHLMGQAAGIDPSSGRIWFGESGVEVLQSMRADGVDTPLFLVRVGSKCYQRKGGHR